MKRQRDELKAGMAVLDAQAEPMGQIQEVNDGLMVIQRQQTMTVPCDTIHEVTEDVVRLDLATLEWLPKAVEELRPAAHTGQVCAACGAIEGDETTVRYVRHDQAWFCLDCWRGLPEAQVAQVVQEVALQGVPVS
jgi:hypothetical protein